MPLDHPHHHSLHHAELRNDSFHLTGGGPGLGPPLPMPWGPWTVCEAFTVSWIPHVPSVGPNEGAQEKSSRHSDHPGTVISNTMNLVDMSITRLLSGLYVSSLIDEKH